MTTRRSPCIACGLSLIVPGVGQWYNGERVKGAAILCMDAGIALGVWLATSGPTALRSWVTALLLGMVYVGVWIPAAIDAYQYAAGFAKPLLSGETAWYVIVMLLSVGPGAIPLLWQSPRFSRRAKTLWTIAVAAIFLGGILCTVVVGPTIDAWLQHLPLGLNTLPSAPSGSW